MSNKKKICATCDKPRTMTSFYSTTSKMFKDKKVPICKKCISEQIDVEDIASVKRILRQIDKPFIQSLWEIAVQSPKDTFGTYMSKVNSLPQYSELTYDDSIEGKKVDEDNDDKGRKKGLDNIDEELVEKWGFGYEPEEYQQFERKYARLEKNYTQKTALHTEGLLSYIRFRVKEEMATAKGDFKEAKEWGAMASKQATDAKLNVSQLSKSDISGGIDVVSQLIEAVETEVGIIPLLPRLLEQPYDDADLIIWATINYNRRLEDKALVPYRDIWNFYDEMLSEHFNSLGLNNKQIVEFKEKRNNVFRDLSNIYTEPLYNDNDEEESEEKENGEEND